MITCPSCAKNQMEGAIFCLECGAQLIGGDPKKPEIKPEIIPHSEFHAKKNQSRKPIREHPPSNALLTLHFLQDDAFIPIQNEGEVILGRIGDGQSVVPDIDLTAYHARDAGVSRLHAELRVSREQTVITDLGSANGTTVNDRRIQAYVLHPLQDGDLVCLGKLKIEVILPHSTNGT